MAKKTSKEWRFTVRLPREWLPLVENARKRDSRTVNSYVAKAVDEKLSREAAK